MALQGRRRMPPTCSICRHAERAAIEEQHIKGTSLREIAKLHSGTTPWSLARHFKHIPAIIAKTTAHEAAQNAATGKLPARVEDLIVEAQKILAGAKKEKQWSPALAALRENRALLELLGRLSGELRPGAAGDFVPGAGAKLGGIGLANRLCSALPRPPNRRTLQDWVRSLMPIEKAISRCWIAFQIGTLSGLCRKHWNGQKGFSTG
jgi:hypothetical protein